MQQPPPAGSTLRGVKLTRTLIAVLILISAVACTREPPPLPEGYKSPPEPTTTYLGPPPAKPLEASWVETFDRPDTEPGVVDGFEVVQRLYEPRLPATDGFIRDGAFTYRGEDQVVYAVREFPGTVRSVGAEGSWRQEREGTTDTVIALVISGNDRLITDMLHFVVDRKTWSLTVRRKNGEFEPVVHGAFPVPLKVGEPYRFRLEATDKTATVSVPGKTLAVDIDTAGVLGPFAFWEQFAKPEQFPVSTVFDYHTVWATAEGQPLLPVPLS